MTGKLLPPNWAMDKASGPVLRRDTGKPFRPELRLEGEKKGGEDSLGTQCQLPVVGAHPLAHPAAKNRVGHGTRLGRRGRDHTCKKQTPALSTAATPPSRKHKAVLDTALLTISKGHSCGKQNRGDLLVSHRVEADRLSPADSDKNIPSSS